MNGRWMMPMPKVGQMVLWYSLADKNTQPYPAVVSELGMDGLCLTVFPPRVPPEPKRGVHHNSDPTLTERPDGKQPAWAKMGGGWDFLEDDPRRGQPAVIAPVKERELAPITPDFDDELRVLELKYRKKVMRPDYIAKQVCSGWDAEVVKKILAKYSVEEAKAILEEHFPSDTPVQEEVEV